MVGPVGKVLRREYMIVGHAEPVLSLSLGWHDVVRRIDIDLVIEDACRRVGSIDAPDNRILCPSCQHGKHEEECNGLFIHKSIIEEVNVNYVGLYCHNIHRKDMQIIPQTSHPTKENLVKWR